MEKDPLGRKDPAVFQTEQTMKEHPDLQSASRTSRGEFYEGGLEVEKALFAPTSDLFATDLHSARLPSRGCNSSLVHTSSLDADPVRRPPTLRRKRGRRCLPLRGYFIRIGVV